MRIRSVVRTRTGSQGTGIARSPRREAALRDEGLSGPGHDGIVDRQDLDRRPTDGRQADEVFTPMASPAPDAPHQIVRHRGCFVRLSNSRALDWRIASSPATRI